MVVMSVAVMPLRRSVSHRGSSAEQISSAIIPPEHDEIDLFKRQLSIAGLPVKRTENLADLG
jgi:hypothetical protein